MKRFALAVLLLASIGCRREEPKASPAPGPAAAGKRPNIVLILIDTLRADDVPWAGYPRDTAPFLARMAAKGTVFERVYSTSGWTVPATASMFTSLYPTQHGLIENLGRKQMRREKQKEKEVAALPAGIKVLPEVLQEAGYRTFGVTDNFHISTLRGFDRGFQRFSNANNTGAEETNARVLQWKDEIRTGEKPYFLYVHYMDPHNPYIRQAPWFDEFTNDGKVPEWQGIRRAAYDSEIRHVDAHIEALSAALRWDENTIVVVTADHGEEFGEHGGAGHASSLYKELVEVPLVAWSSDGRIGARRVSDPVGLIDILPTLRDFAGAAPDPAQQGVSLRPQLEQGAAGDRRRTFFLHIQTFGKRKHMDIEGVQRERWKWLREVPGDTQLFDTYADRGDTKDLSRAEERVADDLAVTWRRFHETARRFETTKHTFHLDQETEDKLRALGYVQ